MTHKDLADMSNHEIKKFNKELFNQWLEDSANNGYRVAMIIPIKYQLDGNGMLPRLCMTMAVEPSKKILEHILNNELKHIKTD